MPNYFCWMDDWNDEETAEEISALDMVMAAEIYAEKVHPHHDYFSEADVSVRDKNGNVKKFSVTVEMEPIFTAKEIKP